MPKNVLRGAEIQISATKVQIPPPKLNFKGTGPIPLTQFQDMDDLDELPEPKGPSPELIEEKLRELSERTQTERESIIEAAREEAKRIIADAEKVAFDEIQRKGAQAQEIRGKADGEAAQKIAEAERKIADMMTDAERRVSNIELDAQQRGFEQGKLDGWEESKREAERVIERLHTILSRAIERRKDILTDSEAQIVALVLNISRKVVKVLTENQKNIVINNVLQALRKLKSKSDVVIRVNIGDMKVTTEHLKEITDRIERVGNVSVMEDSTVDPGGCIIETDFGEIDARISSQLQEIEEKVLEVSPIRSKVRDITS